MRILKFGGSSVSTPERVRAVVAIVRAARREGPAMVVVSAFGGVTDALVLAAAEAARGDDAWAATHRELLTRHLDAVVAVASAGERPALTREVEQAFVELGNLLRGASLVGECSPRTLDSVMSFGERLSAVIVAAALRQAGENAEFCDARLFIVTDQQFGSAQVDLEQTRVRLGVYLEGRVRLQVVTGFIGASPNGATTTLGRGGSDYTASIVGAALDAELIEIWTDVDGVMTADPRQVPEAFSIPSMSYDELMELSHFGAKVVYPPTVRPARAHSIPLLVRNTFNPAFPGTRVGHAQGDASTEARSAKVDICGISSINRVALLRLQGDGMAGVPGIAMRLFGALAREGISVILISQASSEHSIALAVEPAGVARARISIANEFALEQRLGLVDPLIVDDNVSLIAAVGDGIRDRPGAVGRLFGVLASHGIPVQTFAGGSSDRNISIATSRADEARALKAIHGALLFPTRRTIDVYLAGVGRVGSAFLDQLRQQADVLARDENTHVRVAGVASSKRMLIDPRGIDRAAWRTRLADDGEPSDLERFVEALVEPRRPTSVFVDCTASDQPASWFERLIEAGVPVIAANKRPFAGPLDAYRRLKDAVARGAAVHYETTVGAGLPVLGTLSDLVRTGDRVNSIDGVLSGTLGFVLDRLRSGVAFSAAVKDAHARGYSEPDPRDDLMGADVARKILILGREAGYPLEPDAVTTIPLVPAAWSALTQDEFWKELPSLDPLFAAKQAAATAAGQRLCYLARVSAGRATVGLEAVDPSHPCATLSGTDNLIAFSTDRYDTTPLVVRGPGAGPHVTAAGVFADVLRAARTADRP
ncbi:MAG: bifunctional aspartate kinase/homoserine dehydrogenase I [Vicinamibacterales bacterium]